eukprot:3161251-Pyramimonas_sp.AAC.1
MTTEQHTRTHREVGWRTTGYGYGCGLSVLRGSSRSSGEPHPTPRTHSSFTVEKFGCVIGTNEMGTERVGICSKAVP